MLCPCCVAAITSVWLQRVSDHSGLLFVWDHDQKKLFWCAVAVWDDWSQTASKRKKAKKRWEEGQHLLSEDKISSPSGSEQGTYQTFLFLKKGTETLQSPQGLQELLLPFFYHWFLPSLSQSHVPCYCNMPFHAVDHTQHYSGLCWAHRIHEPRLVAGISSGWHQRERGRSGHQSVSAISRPLQPLPSHREPAGDLRAVRHHIWRSGQRFLAGCHVVSGSRDISAGVCGLYLHLQPVFSEHPEEEHIQHLWTASGCWR